MKSNLSICRSLEDYFCDDEIDVDEVKNEEAYELYIRMRNATMVLELLMKTWDLICLKTMDITMVL